MSAAATVYPCSGAGVAELGYAPGLGPGGPCALGGSSPLARINLVAATGMTGAAHEGVPQVDPLKPKSPKVRTTFGETRKG